MGLFVREWPLACVALLAISTSSGAVAQTPVPRPTPQTPQSIPALPAGSTGAGQERAPNAEGTSAPGEEGPGATLGSAGSPGSSSGEATPPTVAPFDAPPAAGAGGDGSGSGADASPALSSGLGGALSGSGESYFGMIGDSSPVSRTLAFPRALRVPRPPGLPDPGTPPRPPSLPGDRDTAVAILPSIQQLKISENQSPRPQDRIYFSFNSFNDVNQGLNERLGTTFRDINIYRYILGLEKTFWDGRASAGLRIPINNVSYKSTLPGFGGTSTAAGDLAAILKYAFLQDPETGSLMSVGLLVSMPTGPGQFAGARGFQSLRNTALSPFLGYIWIRGDFYFQGFSSINVPLDDRDVTMLYNDLGVGYYVYKASKPKQFLTAIIPSFETHINTPLNHRGFATVEDVGFNTYDVVNLTAGCNFVLGGRGVLTLGVVEPVTGPRPFSIETVAQFNLRF